MFLQVCGVLESLEQEYRREEDWCGGGDRQPEQLMPMINKHMEQKEAFLKVKPPQKSVPIHHFGAVNLEVYNKVIFKLRLEVCFPFSGLHSGQTKR